MQYNSIQRVGFMMFGTDYLIGGPCWEAPLAANPPLGPNPTAYMTCQFNQSRRWSQMAGENR